MSRLSLLMMLAIVGGGWYVLKGPGLGQLNQYVGTPGGFQQNAPLGQSAQLTDSYRAANAGSATARPSALQGGPTIRIASFNIQVFDDEKASKPHIMWTLAKIIENFHIVAIQEIRTQDDYFIDSFLRDYLNKGGQRQYDYLISPRLGRSRKKEQYAFIYDTATIEADRSKVYTVNDPDDLLHREPLVATFSARGPSPQEAFTFVLINVRTDPDETDTELDALAKVYRVVRQAAGGEDDVIILGDMNVDDQHLGELGKIRGARPVVRGVLTNTRQTELYDNIVLHQPSTAEFTGRWGVYDVQRLQGLTLDQALQVSDRLPVWAEFSAYESAVPGRVARGGATRVQ